MVNCKTSFDLDFGINLNLGKSNLRILAHQWYLGFCFAVLSLNPCLVTLPKLLETFPNSCWGKMFSWKQTITEMVFGASKGSIQSCPIYLGQGHSIHQALQTQCLVPMKFSKANENIWDWKGKKIIKCLRMLKESCKIEIENV